VKKDAIVREKAKDRERHQEKGMESRVFAQSPQIANCVLLP
jgi:hypothetical protein